MMTASSCEPTTALPGTSWPGAGKPLAGVCCCEAAMSAACTAACSVVKLPLYVGAGTTVADT